VEAAFVEVEVVVLAGVGEGQVGVEAAHAPLRVGHVCDEAEMDSVLGAEALHVVFEDNVEVFLGFECVDGVRGKQPVAEGIEGRTPFSFFGDWAAGEGSVLA